MAELHHQADHSKSLEHQSKAKYVIDLNSDEAKWVIANTIGMTSIFIMQTLSRFKKR